MSDLEPINAEVVFVGDNGQPFTTSLVVADETGNQHKNILELIRENRTDLNEVGRVAFETRPFETAGGTQRREVAVLDEPASALLMTYLRNTPKVKDFKKRLVAGFYELRRIVAEGPRRALTPLERMAQAVLEAKDIIAEQGEEILQLTAKVEEGAPKVNYVNTYVSSQHVLKLRTVAANNHVSEEWLRQLLLDRGWIYAEVERYYSKTKEQIVTRRRYSAYSHKQQYFKPVELHDVPLFRGEVMHTLKVTPPGAEAITRLIAKEIAA